MSDVRVFRYRWVILLTFCLYSAINFLQFVQYTIIANITAKYYEVEDALVDLTGLVFMILFIVLVIPVSYVIEKYNLRITAIVSSGLTTCGNLVKLLSVSRDRFYVVLVGQSLCAVGQVFMLCVPSKLASTWFGAEEVSTACAIAILGTQVGTALGCIFPANVVRNSENFDDIGDDFWVLNIVNASMTVATFLMVLIFFRAKPSLPPSHSQVELVENARIFFWESVKAMAKSKNYWLILVAFGSCNGIYTCFGIVINQIYLHYFPGSESQIGIVAAAAVISGGCIGSVIFGLILDRWHHFKLTSFLMMAAASITYMLVGLSLQLYSQITSYFTIPIFGFFVASTLLVGFEFATEVMYPVPEAISCGVLNTVIYLFGITYTFIYDALIDSLGYVLLLHVIMTMFLAAGAVLVLFIRPRLRRREANIANENYLQWHFLER